MRNILIFLSALVIAQPLRAEDVPEKYRPMVKKGLDWMSKATVNLRDQLASPQHKQTWYSDRYANTDLAKMAYTLALYKKKPAKKVMDWLVENSDSLTPEAASYSAIVLKNAGNSHWKDCYKRLMSAAYIHDQFADWDHTSWLYSHLGYSAKWDYDYRFTGEETTAMALRAVLVVDPNNTDLIEKIKNWLLIQRDNNGWVNTKTTAEVFLALLEEQVAFNKKGSGTGTATLEVQLADKLLNDLVFNQTTAYAPETAVNVPVLNLPEKVTLKKSGGGRVYYNSLETYIQKLQPGEKMTAHCIPSGLSLERSFYRLVPTAKTSDGRTVFDTKIISNNVIHAGETVLMKVKVNCPVPLPYVILEAYLPSGAEIVTNSAKEETTTKDPFNWYIHWWTHQDILDDRIVFFVTNMREGVSEFSTLVRMEMPGHYEMNPLRIEGMYAKNVRGYSTLDELQVSE